MTGCPGPDSNRDALRRCPLKTVCLPVSPPGPIKTCGGQLGGQRSYGARGSPRLTTAYHREPPPPQDSVSTSFTTRACQTSGGQLGGQQSYCARGSPRLTTAYHREPPPPQDSVSTSFTTRAGKQR